MGAFFMLHSVRGRKPTHSPNSLIFSIILWQNCWQTRKLCYRKDDRALYKWIEWAVVEIWPFEIIQDGGLLPTWIWCSDVKRGQSLEAEVEAKASRPRPELRGQDYEVEAEAEAKSNYEKSTK